MLAASWLLCCKTPATATSVQGCQIMIWVLFTFSRLPARFILAHLLVCAGLHHEVALVTVPLFQRIRNRARFLLVQAFNAAPVDVIKQVTGLLRHFVKLLLSLERQIVLGAIRAKPYSSHDSSLSFFLHFRPRCRLLLQPDARIGTVINATNSIARHRHATLFRQIGELQLYIYNASHPNGIPGLQPQVQPLS